MCSTTTTTSSNKSSSSSSSSAAAAAAAAASAKPEIAKNNNGSSPPSNEPPPSPPPYTLRDHCHYLKLRTEHINNNITKASYWYCDFTSDFVQRQDERLLKDIVKDYCQPFGTLAELQDQHVGISALSPHTEDPLAVRTVSMKLRPDARHYTILRAVHQAFTTLHRSDYHIVASTPQTFQAIGANGSTPYFVAAFVGIHNQTLERRLWIRFYHVESVPLLDDTDTDTENETDNSSSVRAWLQRRIQSASNSNSNNASSAQMAAAPLRNALTPINIKFAEACRLVKYVMDDGALEPSSPCPEINQIETSRFFQTNNLGSNNTSSSALEESKNLARHRTVTHLFPALAKDDYPILQESFALLDRIWSELEDQKCTYNTLLEETSRFGMRPCQATLDKEFCFGLSQISQQRMLLELQVQVATAESNLHETQSQYQELESLLIHVLRRKYRIPILEDTKNDNQNHNNTKDSNSTGQQTPVKLPKRKLADFPWHETVQKALADVSHQIAERCFLAFDPKDSLQMADGAVQHVYTAFGVRDDMDQQLFLKERNRQAMIRIAQQQASLKRLLETILLAPTQWPSLPRLNSACQTWYEISLQSTTSNTRRNPVPLVEFRTKLGQGCVTAHQLILMSGLLSTSVQVYDLVEVDLQATPNHRLTKISIMDNNGLRLGGFNPVDIPMEKLVQHVQILKQMQEA